MNSLIYKCTCLVNGKVYIGLTTKGLEHRVNNHERTSKSTTRNSILYNAMKKYGKDNFIWNVVEYCDESELEKREIFWIKYFDSFRNGYNATTGGERKKEVSKESRERMSKGHKGQVSWCKGKKLPPLTDNHKRRIREFANSHKQENRIKQITRKIIRCKETGEIFNSIRECCEKMNLNKHSVSRNLRGIYQSAGGYWNKGFHFEQVVKSLAGGYNS